jgi:hypothetical protein
MALGRPGTVLPLGWGAVAPFRPLAWTSRETTPPSPRPSPSEREREPFGSPAPERGRGFDPLAPEGGEGQSEGATYHAEGTFVNDVR